MLVTAGREKDTDTEKQRAIRHVSMVARRKANGLACAVGDTCAEGQVNRRISKAQYVEIASRGLKSRSSDLVDTLHIIHAGDSADIGEDGLELAAIGDFQAGVDARVRAIRSAFQAVDVGSGAADYGGNISQKARPNRGAAQKLPPGRRKAPGPPPHRRCAARFVPSIFDGRPP